MVKEIIENLIRELKGIEFFDFPVILLIYTIICLVLPYYLAEKKINKILFSLLLSSFGAIFLFRDWKGNYILIALTIIIASFGLIKSLTKNQEEI